MRDGQFGVEILEMVSRVPKRLSSPANFVIFLAIFDSVACLIFELEICRIKLQEIKLFFVSLHLSCFKEYSIFA
jgi:hypothetical protein